MTNIKPGIHPSIELSRIGQSERKIIRNLGKVWFITLVRYINPKASDYMYAFVKPTDELTDAFHLEKEVLVLFNPYDSFEPRSLNIAEKILLSSPNKLDRLCIMLISHDIRVRDKIKKMTMENPELKIIVPFIFDELLSSDIRQVVEYRLVKGILL